MKKKIRVTSSNPINPASVPFVEWKLSWTHDESLMWAAKQGFPVDSPGHLSTMYYPSELLGWAGSWGHSVVVVRFLSHWKIPESGARGLLLCLMKLTHNRGS